MPAILPNAVHRLFSFLGLPIQLFVWLAIPLFSIGQEVSASLPWHHSGSPFRAVFSLHSPPSPAALDGFILEVPVFNFGSPEGHDVYCYDSQGRQLRRAELGPGRPDHVLIHVQPVSSKRLICAYFGSRRRAPVARVAQSPMLAEVYRLPSSQLPDWPAVQASLNSAEKIGAFTIDRLEAAVNPLDSTGQFIMVMTASMSVKQKATRNFFLAHSGAGYLLVDDVLRVERNGNNNVHASRRGENRESVSLSAGSHAIKVVGVNFDGQFFLSLGEWFSEPRVASVLSTEFIQQGRSQLLQVESKRSDGANPIFHYQHLSYMGLEEGQLTETTLATWSGQEAEWHFDDGLKLSGSVVKRVFSGLSSIPVRVTVSRSTCSGSINFPGQAPPRQYLASKALDYQHYEQLLLTAGFSGIKNRESLQLLLAFFQRRDFHPAQIELSEALIANRSLDEKERLTAMIDLTRAAALTAPEKTLRTYNSLFKMRLNRAQMAQLLPEAIDFAVFRMRDCSLAEQILKRYETRLPKNSERLLANMRFDIALQSGNLSEAKSWYMALTKRPKRSDEQKKAAVQGNALQEAVADAISAGRLLDAEIALREWMQIAPQDRGNGSYSLQKSRLLRQKKWLEGALGELNGAILADPLLPNLPEIEFEKAEILMECGDQQQAKELFNRIKNEYPNHPLASKATQKLK